MKRQVGKQGRQEVFAFYNYIVGLRGPQLSIVKLCHYVTIPSQIGTKVCVACNLVTIYCNFYLY